MPKFFDREPYCLSAAEFLACLDAWKLTDSDAARVFNVSYSTIKYWAAHGVAGPGAQLIRLMNETQASPFYVAQTLRIPLSSYIREQFPRGSSSLLAMKSAAKNDERNVKDYGNGT